ncbi:MAG: general secretion pathway protein GspK, partial [Candidatus Omnitrophica bacterium]|nr:general secretion pathway protein GspK [Candidatus Omnitrophota bacterium]
MNKGVTKRPQYRTIHEDGTILIISLWIILILSVLALSLGMRGALEAKIARFYHERVSEKALARTGIDLARFIIESDKDQRVDSRNDTWYNPESIQQVLDANSLRQLTIEIKDEESRININIASEKVLERLFEYYGEHSGLGGGDVADKVADTLYFRGDSALRGETSLGKDYAGRPFWNLEDLLLLEHIRSSDLEVVYGLITVFP